MQRRPPVRFWERNSRTTSSAWFRVSLVAVLPFVDASRVVSSLATLTNSTGARTFRIAGVYFIVEARVLRSAIESSPE
jgi:hypothetical protein